MLITPKGTTVVGSAVLSQVEQTYEKEFRNDFPVELVQSENKTKKTYTLCNGHQVMIKSYYEEGLLRSLTASRWHIVEASEVDFEIYVQLKTRLRDVAGILPELDGDGNLQYEEDGEGNISIKAIADWRKGIVESNPDAGWIRSDFLLQSGKIDTHGLPQEYEVSSPDKDISTHIIGTRANPYLPAGFYESNAKNRPIWWIARYLNGSFDYAEGLVYPSARKAFHEPFSIPSSWPRIVAMDYGIRDQTAIIYLAIDRLNKKAYIFDEVYINNVNYEVTAKIYWDKSAENIPKGTLFRPPVMDGRSINKRNDVDLRTIGDLFAEEGIFFQPAQMSLATRIAKLNTLLEAGDLYIFRSCKNLCNEIMNYKFPERTATGKATSDKPEDKKNHAINALEFAIMELPEDLGETTNNAYDQNGYLLKQQPKKAKAPTYNPFGQEAPEGDTGDFGRLFQPFKEGDRLW